MNCLRTSSRKLLNVEVELSEREEVMKASLVDTNILSLFFKGQAQVVSQFEAYLEEYETINLSIITYYEIVSGLKHRDAHKQLDQFLEFAAQNRILPLTQEVADRTQAYPFNPTHLNKWKH